ncbi:MAG TPA: hypothetical protein VMT20_26990 [Terriglobia bacterium]|nr:hypothetical protein [Terriglobia bacterium]
MLKKVKRIKLGQQAYRRLLKKVLEQDGWSVPEVRLAKEPPVPSPQVS